MGSCVTIELDGSKAEIARILDYFEAESNLGCYIMPVGKPERTGAPDGFLALYKLVFYT